MTKLLNRSTLVALGLALTLFSPGSAKAEIAFDAMPVGCSWTTGYSDGQVVTETYLGKVSGKNKTRVTRADNPKALIRHSLYDAEGRLVRKDWADGNWERFTPYSCFDVPGTCTYRYTNSSGVDQMIRNKTATKGKGFTVKAGPSGAAAYPDEYFEVGDLGVMTRNKSATYSARLVGMRNCTTGS